MPVFTPPTYKEHSDDFFFGRFGVPVGESVVKVNGAFVTQITPWAGELRPDINNKATDLVEGVDWFQGGRTYFVSSSTATALTSAGFAVDTATPAYGFGLYGANNYGG